MPTVYRIEVSPNARAKCQNAECKKNNVKLEKGDLRHGSWVEIPDGKGGTNASWKWKHWGCVTPVQFESWKAITNEEPDLIDGYDELPEEYQERVMRALKQGHVDDEDWMGDLIKNRPGQKGFRATIADKQTEAKAQQELDEAQGNGESSKPKSKKRGRAQKEEDEDEEEVVEKAAPKSKKPRGQPKKEEQDVEDSDEPKPKKGRGRPKKNVEADGDEEAAPKKKAVKKSKKVEVAEDEDVEPAVKKVAKGGKKAKAGEDEEVERAAKGKRGRAKKGAA